MLDIKQFFADLNQLYEVGALDNGLARKLFGAAIKAWFEEVFHNVEHDEKRPRASKPGFFHVQSAAVTIPAPLYWELLVGGFGEKSRAVAGDPTEFSDSKSPAISRRSCISAGRGCGAIPRSHPITGMLY